MRCEIFCANANVIDAGEIWLLLILDLGLSLKMLQVSRVLIFITVSEGNDVTGSSNLFFDTISIYRYMFQSYSSNGKLHTACSCVCFCQSPFSLENKKS